MLIASGSDHLGPAMPNLGTANIPLGGTRSGPKVDADGTLPGQKILIGLVTQWEARCWCGVLRHGLVIGSDRSLSGKMAVSARCSS